jgi:hypothetical protein
MISYKNMAKVMRRKLDVLQVGVATDWAVGALVAASDAAPRPGQGVTPATGRARESLTVSKGSLRYDPGIRGRYKKPGVRDARRMMKMHRPGHPVVLQMGVHYDWNVERYYPWLKKARIGGAAGILAGRRKLLAKVRKTR